MKRTFKTLTTATCLAALCAATTPAAANNRPLPGHQTLEIMDAQGFGQPVRAYTISVPQGWKAQGGVIWTPQDTCNPYGYNINWRASTPDETTGVALIPAIRWTNGPSDGIRNCPSLQVSSARDMIELILRETTQGQARIIDYRPRPDYLAEIGLKGSHTNNYGFTSTVKVDAGEALVSVVENGVELRLSVGLAVSMWSMSEADPGFRAPVTMSGGISFPGFVASAPAGQLDLAVVERIRKSVQVDPRWNQQIVRHHQVIDRQNAKGAADRSRITTQTNREISDIIHQGYLERSRSSDRMHRETIEALTDTETYHDPYNGGTVTLDNSYNHAWQLNNGDYVQTNDPNFNPYSDLGMDGQELRVVE